MGQNIHELFKGKNVHVFINLQSVVCACTELIYFYLRVCAHAYFYRFRSKFEKSAHCEFIVWVLFTFPKRSGVLELVHFVGSVIAAREQERTGLREHFDLRTVTPSSL